MRIRSRVNRFANIILMRILKKKKFDFFIIGAQKCGTTSLFDYLNMHPLCTGASTKETCFFSHHYKEGIKSISLYFYKNTRALLRGAFENYRKNTLWFEATPDYVYMKEVPERIYNYNPDARLIFLVREPVSRAISEYNMACWYAKERNLCVREDPDLTYFECLKNPDTYTFSWFINEEFRKMKESDSYSPSAFKYPDFIRHGLYSEQLDRYYKYFKPEQILVIEDKQLKKNRLETLCLIEDFLKIPHLNWSEKQLVNSNVGVYNLPIQEDCKQALYQFFSVWNEKFFERIGRRMDWTRPDNH